MGAIFSKINFYKNELKSITIFEFIRRRARHFFDQATYYRSLLFLSRQSFLFNGEKYHYLVHKYNFTWTNERAVEVPIAYHFANQYNPKDILEVGNVLKHYYNCSHKVIDKYEKQKDVINSDVVDFKSNKKYKLILAISTLEHVGWDETPQEKDKIIKATNNLKKLLQKNGKLIITLPLGYYNPTLNSIIKNNTLKFKDRYYMKRISRTNIWKQINENESKDLKYNYPFPHANGIIIGEISN